MQALGLVWSELDCNAPDYRERFFNLDAPRHADAQITYEIWQERTASDNFVVGRDIPSRALRRMLRNLAVYEPVEQSDDWKVRIAGTAFYRRFGRDVTGEHLSSLFRATTFSALVTILDSVIGSGRPRSLDVERSQGMRAAMNFELLLLPALSPGRNAAWIVAGLFFHD